MVDVRDDRKIPDISLVHMKGTLSQRSTPTADRAERAIRPEARDHGVPVDRLATTEIIADRFSAPVPPGAGPPASSRHSRRIRSEPPPVPS